MLTTSCGPPVPSDAREALDVLSRAILAPERTCTQLRRSFGLEWLPIVADPGELGLPYEEHFVPTADGVLLRTWYIPSDEDRGLVVFSMGASGTAACYLFTPLLLHPRGWSVVIYEYEGFGESGGEAGLDTLIRDLETVVDWSRAHTGRSQVTLMAMSLGSIPSVAVAVSRPDAVNAVILDSPVALGVELLRFDAFVYGRMEQVIGLLDPALISEEIVDQMGQPLLVLLGEEDMVTPPATVELLYDRAAGPKELVRFPGLSHGLAQFVDSARYTAHVDSFLQGVWEPAGPVFSASAPPLPR